jgi:nucleotide-binding universal stress UspA family protein
MFKQIVVGVDEHASGRDAIALAKRLVAPDGQLTLGFIYCGDEYVYRGTNTPVEPTYRERTLDRLRAAAAEAGVAAGVSFVGSTSAGRGLHELAERQGADLIVLGSCRRSLIGRVLMGDDTHAALNHAPCAVAIAPAGYMSEPAVIREIGVGYDGSPESEHALEVARRLADQMGAKLSACEAVSLPRHLFAGDSAPIDESIEEIVNDARDRISALGGVEAHAAYGHAAEELAIYSASLDLLIVGSRGFGPIGRLIHGSTSQQLAHTARCALLVLPRGAQRAGQQRDARESSRDDAAADRVTAESATR